MKIYAARFSPNYSGNPCENKVLFFLAKKERLKEAPFFA